MIPLLSIGEDSSSRWLLLACHFYQLIYQFVHFFCLCKFVYTNLYFLVHSFVFGIQHKYLEPYMNWYKNIWCNSEKNHKEKGRSPLEPKESIQKSMKKKRYSLNIDSIWIRLYNKTIWKSGLYNFSGMAYSQPLHILREDNSSADLVQLKSTFP